MKTNIMFVIAVILSGILHSCTPSSPNKLGEHIAQMYNDSNEELARNIDDIHNSFIQDFNKDSFTTRVEARNQLNSAIDAAIQKHDIAHTKAEAAYHEAERSFEENYDKFLSFREAFRHTIKQFDTKRVKNTAYSNTHINKLILTIIPPEPTKSKVEEDLVGRTIREPRTGYNGGDTKWNIEEGEIKSLKIINKSEDDGDILYQLYIRLQANGGAVDVLCTARYVLSTYDDWTISLVTTEQFDIVKTGKYNDCIEVHPAKYAGYSFYNKSDSVLMIGGVYYWNGKWRKFQESIPGNSSCDYLCEDYEIHFIEKPY